MGIEDRKKLITKIEELRQSKVICYLTSVRPNLNAMISQDAVREFFEHLRLLPEKPAAKIDIFLVSNGGNGTVPWRLISLFREFSEKIGVLLPYRAYSAATMLALGADEIVMHPFAEMGPIDPTVTNEFNPNDPTTNQKLGISVEDVKAYISFIKDTVGIRHEDELIKAIQILADKVHPLALGNVERFISQSRMIARKLLATHMDEIANKHNIEEIVETLASKLYFHGHPINRKEAVQLGLAVTHNAQPELESAIWNLYLDFEIEFQNNDVYDPMAEIYKKMAAQAGIPPGGVSPLIDVELTARYAMIESSVLCSQYDASRRYVVAGTGAIGEPIVRQEQLSQGWTRKPT